jgi:signal transduction histidine kinase
MIRPSDLYSFIESNFEFLLAVDASESILHASRLLCRSCGPGELAHESRKLSQVLTPPSLKSFRSGMALAREGQRRLAIYSPKEFPGCEIPLKTGYAESSGGGIWIFFGSQLDGINRQTEYDREERIKELACLYAVAEWIEISSGVREFFTRLPDYLSKGMIYPGQAMVYSSYQGQEYGQMPPGEHYISVKLLSNQQIAGEIRVGYANPGLELLPEEQRMLSEIGRMLNLALERKDLRDRMILKQEEEAAFTQRFAEMQTEIEARTLELEQQKVRLERINKYLDSVNRGWSESASRLDSMFRAIPDDVAVIDLNRNIVMTNRKDTASEGKCYTSFFGASVPCSDCRLSRIIRDKAPIVHTIKAGERFLEVHAIPVFDHDQEVEGIIEFYRDVTLEKTYEQQIQQADKLASLGQLVSGIGHEINNPNQFIRGNIKIIRQALEDMLPIVDDYAASHPDLKIARLKYDFFRSNVLTLVDDMAHGSERIKGIVEGLRNFARKDEGLLIDRVDVNTLIQAAARLVANEVHKHAEISLQLDPGLPTFDGNAQKIEQVIINLLVNSAQAMPDDRRGMISVRTRQEDGRIVIEVEDDGRGMNEKTLKQIFDPFFTTKRAKGGTGLGLPIAYRIIEEHGGAISVTSTPGEGTRFTVRIPLKAGQPGSDPKKAQSAGEES